MAWQDLNLPGHATSLDATDQQTRPTGCHLTTDTGEGGFNQLGSQTNRQPTRARSEPQSVKPNNPPGAPPEQPFRGQRSRLHRRSPTSRQQPANGIVTASGQTQARMLRWVEIPEFLLFRKRSGPDPEVLRQFIARRLPSALGLTGSMELATWSPLPLRPPRPSTAPLR